MAELYADGGMTCRAACCECADGGRARPCWYTVAREGAGVVLLCAVRVGEVRAAGIFGGAGYERGSVGGVPGGSGPGHGQGVR